MKKLTKPRSVRKELSELVPVLTEMHRRQDPDRCKARDCSHYIHKAHLCFVYSPRNRLLPSYRCPECCNYYQPRPMEDG
jgi:hypothetical protein